MNTYGARMQEHYLRYRPNDLARVIDPVTFFEDLGLQIEVEIDQRADGIVGTLNPAMGFVERATALKTARVEAESQVMREYLESGLTSSL